jgi:hypothetical protein
VITDTITINFHDNDQWSIASHKFHRTEFGDLPEEEPNMAVGGPLTERQVIAVVTEWVVNGPAEPDQVIELLGAVRRLEEEELA